jgi:hypothetical protein
MPHPFYRETSINAQEGPKSSAIWPSWDLWWNTPRAIIWDPFTEANIWKLEMVQRRATRMIFSDYRRTSCVTPMLQHLQYVAYRPCQGDHDEPHSKRPSWSPNIQPHPNQLCSRTWTSLPGTICKNPVLPAILLPRHRPPLEQSSPDSSIGKYYHSFSDSLSSVFTFLPALYIEPFKSLLYIHRHFSHRAALGRVYAGRCLYHIGRRRFCLSFLCGDE